jgi:transposase
LGDLTDDEWEILETQIARTQTYSRTASSVLRLTVNGILWRMRTGSPWRFIPDEYGNWSSIRRRFQDWDESGLWRTVTVTLADLRRMRGDTPPMPFSATITGCEAARPQP